MIVMPPMECPARTAGRASVASSTACRDCHGLGTRQRAPAEPGPVIVVRSEQSGLFRPEASVERGTGRAQGHRASDQQKAAASGSGSACDVVGHEDQA